MRTFNHARAFLVWQFLSVLRASEHQPLNHFFKDMTLLTILAARVSLATLVLFRCYEYLPSATM